MIKKYSGHIIGFLSSIVFFMTLAYIVKPSSESLKNENSFRVVDFIRLKKDTSLKEKSRTIPDKPEPPKKPPPPELVTPELSAPKVVQSKPPRVFDSSALRAIKKWKFKPKVVNGIAVQQAGTQVIEFKLF